MCLNPSLICLLLVWVSRPCSEDVDFFLEHWGSEIYGQDGHGHYVWLERVTTIHALELLARFDDDHMKDTRSVLMEVSLTVVRTSTAGVLQRVAKGRDSSICIIEDDIDRARLALAAQRFQVHNES